MLGQNRAVIREMLENRGSIDPRTHTRHKYRKDPDGKSCKDSITKMKMKLKKFHEPWYDVLAKYEKDGPNTLAGAGAGASGSANTVPDTQSERPAQQKDANAAELKVEDPTSPQPDWTHVQPEVSAPVPARNERIIQEHRSFPPFSSSRLSYYPSNDSAAAHNDPDESLPLGVRRLVPTVRVGDRGEIQKISNRNKKDTMRDRKRRSEEDDQYSPQAAVRRARLHRLRTEGLSQLLQSDSTDPFLSPGLTSQAASTSTTGGTAATDLAVVHATEAAGLTPAEFQAYLEEMTRQYRENHREGGSS